MEEQKENVPEDSKTLSDSEKQNPAQKQNSGKKQNKTWWHPAFVAAMKLDLREYAEYLYFETEHILSKGSIKADLLLMKKEEISMEDHEWGKFFERHNLFEYKGIGDSLNWKTFSKGLGYAHFYAMQEKSGESRKWNEVTLTFLRQARPNKLFKTLKKYDFAVEKREEGVYYIGNKTIFKVQIIVLKEVSFEKHPWLAALTKQINSEQLKMLFHKKEELEDREDIENALAVMEVVAKANTEVLREVVGGGTLMLRSNIIFMRSDDLAGLRSNRAITY